MAEADAVVEFRVVINRGPDIVHDEVYVLDLDAPHWERFDLTYSEQRRCDALLGAAKELWAGDHDRRAAPDDPPEPVRALLETMVDVIGEALKRTLERSPSSMQIA